VNVRREESDTRAVEEAELKAILPGRLATGTSGVREWREEIHREVPLWPWLLAAAALVFLTEGRLSAKAAKLREVGVGNGLPKWMQGRARA
jgi:hypothetical protein